MLSACEYLLYIILSVVSFQLYIQSLLSIVGDIDREIPDFAREKSLAPLKDIFFKGRYFLEGYLLQGEIFS